MSVTMGGIDGDMIREIEARTIREFVRDALDTLVGGRLLDFGCGKQPYRDLVEAVGIEYLGYDRPGFPGSVVTEPEGQTEGGLDAILCTQVLQYVTDPYAVIRAFRQMLVPGGLLILTYPTTWPEVEREDLWRFTHAGVSEMFAYGWTVLRHEPRAVLLAPRFNLTIGYGLAAESLP